jgi:hypothetical protein
MLYLVITLVVLAAAGYGIFRIGRWLALGVSAAVLVLGAGTGIWLYTKRAEPVEQPCALPASAGVLGAVCGFNNPEDIEYVASRDLLLVTEEGLGGRILALRPGETHPRVLWPSASAPRGKGDPRCRPPSSAARVSTQGLSILDRGPQAPARVAIILHQVQHGVLSDSVQLFDLKSAAELVWVGCIPYPREVIGNDLALLADGSILATNYAPAGAPADLGRAVLRGALGYNTGDVIRWVPKRGWSHIPGTEGAIPNGITLSRDQKTFYFADAGHWRVSIGRLGGDSAITHVDVGGAPDNLSLAPSGAVLATVNTLHGDVPFLCSLGGRQCRSGWAVWEIDPASRKAREVLADNGQRFATATSALEHGGRLYIGSMAEDRIAVYRMR